jgi:hypothetical protein
MTALSPLAAAIAELAADPTVSGITSRIRPIEPGAQDALGPGKYVPFVVVSVLDAPWQAETATSSVTLGLRCYAPTFATAEALYLACAAVFHRKGPRIATSRLGVYNSLVTGGGVFDKDPDTAQPLVHGIVELNVSIQATPA